MAQDLHLAAALAAKDDTLCHQQLRGGAANLSRSKRIVLNHCISDVSHQYVTVSPAVPLHVLTDYEPAVSHHAPHMALRLVVCHTFRRITKVPLNYMDLPRSQPVCHPCIYEYAARPTTSEDNNLCACHVQVSDHRDKPEPQPHKNSIPIAALAPMIARQIRIECDHAKYEISLLRLSRRHAYEM
eukprot:CAMPEP_0119335574 /NCGR_PEP_ID=MMETSP1333-20130426/89867_1 /TAXON_ID=418940 /ORGANISM="Scyphosphaera apsteinii, Strain RCC1455" /LENGTH=184 /DNA_ID=CAMNT_0007346157 /DNA_START=461 /DNA_END=1015 /DNA_ORIENTATION=-